MRTLLMSLDRFKKISYPVFLVILGSTVGPQKYRLPLLAGGFSSGPLGDPDKRPAPIFQKPTTFNVHYLLQGCLLDGQATKLAQPDSPTTFLCVAGLGEWPTSSSENSLIVHTCKECQNVLSDSIPIISLSLTTNTF